MSPPTANSESRKRREGDPEIGPTPLPGYILTTRGEAGRAGWEWRWIEDVHEEHIFTLDLSDDWQAPGDPEEWSLDFHLVIARPPRPRTVTIELPADSAERWAEQTWISDDLTAITAACRASRDAEQ